MLGKKGLILSFLIFLSTASILYRIFFYKPKLAVMAVTRGNIQQEVHGPGTVQSKIQVEVSTKITGIIEELYADEGDWVKKGKLLAQLENRDLLARVKAAKAGLERAQRYVIQAEAGLSKAKADLALARRNYERDLEVYKPGYLSKAAFDATEAALRVAESEVEEARALLEARRADHQSAFAEVRYAQSQLSYTKVHSPMGGLIIKRNLEVGDTVVPGNPIFQMVDTQKVWVATLIDENVTGKIRVGQKAEVHLRSGREEKGYVARITRMADPVTRELEVDVQFDQPPEHFTIGEEADVTIYVREKEGVLKVPSYTLVRRDKKVGLFLVQEGRVGFKPVNVGIINDREAEVTAGLREGDLILLHPKGIREGQKMTPTLSQAEKAED